MEGRFDQEDGIKTERNSCDASRQVSHIFTLSERAFQECIAISCIYFHLYLFFFSLEDVSRMEYQTVRVKGQFLHDKELYLGPRGLIRQNEGESAGGLFSQQNQTNGYLVITPFKLSGRE